MNTLLTPSYLANIGCAAGIDSGQFNACEVWIGLSMDASVHIRLCDRQKPRHWTKPPTGMSWGWAYFEDAPADGSEITIILGVGILEQTADYVRSQIERHIPICQCA